MSLRFLVILILAVSLPACSSAPPASAPVTKSAATPATPEKPRMIELFCAEGARYLSFDKLSVPSGETPVDVALTRGSIWVLFPHRLLQLGRGGEHVEVKIHMAPPDDEWSKIDGDPLDESVWVASLTRPVLFKLTADGQLRTVKLQKVEGPGGFSDLLVARDALYALPTCADMAVWRIGRSGKVLGMAFQNPKPATDEPEVLQPDQVRLRCLGVRLDRDAAGNILAWNFRDRTTWQVDGQGAWTPSDSRLFEHLPGVDEVAAVKGVYIGEASEHWYFNTGAWAPGKLFFWKGKPAFLGSYANREKAIGADTVLYLPGDAGPREVLMSCQKSYVLAVATDTAGYAAVTDRFLVLGELATAPDLP
jgi:hypothetical protein